MVSSDFRIPTSDFASPYNSATAAMAAAIAKKTTACCQNDASGSPSSGGQMRSKTAWTRRFMGEAASGGELPLYNGRPATAQRARQQSFTPRAGRSVQK